MPGGASREELQRSGFRDEKDYMHWEVTYAAILAKYDSDFARLGMNDNWGEIAYWEAFRIFVKNVWKKDLSVNFLLDFYLDMVAIEGKMSATRKMDPAARLAMAITPVREDSMPKPPGAHTPVLQEKTRAREKYEQRENEKQAARALEEERRKAARRPEPDIKEDVRQRSGAEREGLEPENGDKKDDDE
jgi:hypothetical protein